MVAKQKVVAILGPTASGKTALAVWVAQQFNGEVISADSRQVYRGLDIGTEKTTLKEMNGVPHHLIDVADPADTYTVSDFVRDGRQAVQEITKRKHLPVIAGGTFFYVDALTGGTSIPFVAPNPELRAQLGRKRTEELFAELEELDPRRAADIDKNNRRRLIRALEIVHEFGMVPPRSDRDEHYDVLRIAIKHDPNELRSRIEKRLKETLARGLVAETKALLNDGLTPARLHEIGLEYRVVLEYLQSDITEAQMEEKLVAKVWQYAKRQMTWLRRDHTVHWHDPADTDGIHRHIKSFLARPVV